MDYIQVPAWVFEILFCVVIAVATFVGYIIAITQISEENRYFLGVVFGLAAGIAIVLFSQWIS